MEKEKKKKRCWDLDQRENRRKRDKERRETKPERNPTNEILLIQIYYRNCSLLLFLFIFFSFFVYARVESERDILAIFYAWIIKNISEQNIE